MMRHSRTSGGQVTRKPAARVRAKTIDPREPGADLSPFGSVSTQEQYLCRRAVRGFADGGIQGWWLPILRSSAFGVAKAKGRRARSHIAGWRFESGGRGGEAGTLGAVPVAGAFAPQIQRRVGDV